jgi:hypothetical protein
LYSVRAMAVRDTDGLTEFRRAPQQLSFGEKALNS